MPVIERGQRGVRAGEGGIGVVVFGESRLTGLLQKWQTSILILAGSTEVSKSKVQGVGEDEAYGVEDLSSLSLANQPLLVGGLEDHEKKSSSNAYLILSVRYQPT